MSTTRKLRLGPLPKTESVKLTFACPAALTRTCPFPTLRQRSRLRTWRCVRSRAR